MPFRRRIWWDRRRNISRFKKIKTKGQMLLLLTCLNASTISWKWCLKTNVVPTTWLKIGLPAYRLPYMLTTTQSADWRRQLWCDQKPLNLFWKKQTAYSLFLSLYSNLKISLYQDYYYSFSLLSWVFSAAGSSTMLQITVSILKFADVSFPISTM